MAQQGTARRDLPSISVVTPSYNHARFLEESIRSVLSQGYPALEYAVIDGGSTDGSVEIIERYAGQLSHWVSEPDGGQHDAVNKGLARATGQIMAVMNADDLYLPWALALVAAIFSELPEVEWLTTLRPLRLDAAGRAVACPAIPGYGRRAFLRGENLPRAGRYSGEFVQQESTFWRRSLWERAGARVEPLLAWDFELWARYFDHARLYGVPVPIAGFRAHGDQQSARQAEEYEASARQVLERRGHHLYERGEAFARYSLLYGLPRRVRRWAGALGLLEPRMVCQHSSIAGRWIALETY
jgi:glycosyltransferase involved in cell wall biosynthesis